MNHDQLTEIFVQSDKNSSLPVRMVQNLIIARILRPIAGPNHVVSGPLKRIANLSRYAGIDKQLHDVGSVGHGSTRSCPTTLRA